MLRSNEEPLLDSLAWWWGFGAIICSQNECLLVNVLAWVAGWFLDTKLNDTTLLLCATAVHGILGAPFFCGVGSKLTNSPLAAHDT